MSLRSAFAILVTVLSLCFLAFGEPGTSQQVTGYVIDSTCAKTVSRAQEVDRECVTRCAKAGSPLVILSDDRTVYRPLSASEPTTEQNKRLLPYAGQRVQVQGIVYDRGASKAIVIMKIQEVAKK